MSESPNVRSTRMSIGSWSLIAGVVALVGVLMTGQASFEWIPGFDPPGWLRIVSGWMIPVGVVAAVALGARALSRRSGRVLGVVGILLGAATVAIFVAYLVTHPY